MATWAKESRGFQSLVILLQEALAHREGLIRSWVWNGVRYEAEGKTDAHAPTNCSAQLLRSLYLQRKLYACVCLIKVHVRRMNLKCVSVGLGKSGQLPSCKEPCSGKLSGRGKQNRTEHVQPLLIDKIRLGSSHES